MYRILKGTSKVIFVLSAVGLFLAASVNSDARERAGAVGRTMEPSGLALNEILGMEVRTNTGEEIASIDDVILSRDGEAVEVVLDYEGDLVAVPIGDIRFTRRDHAVYEGTRSDLDAALGYYVYGQGPYVYPSDSGAVTDSETVRRGYYGADVRYGTGLRIDSGSPEDRDLVFSGPDTPDSPGYYGSPGYGAQMRFGSRIPMNPDYQYREMDEGYAPEEERGYYDRSEVRSGGYGAELRYGPSRSE